MKKKSPYKSLKHKSFRQAFIQMLENDFSILGSGKVLDLLTNNTLELIMNYMPERIIPGKTIVSAISKDAPKGHHRGVKGLPQVPIELDVINEKLINQFAEGDKIRDIKKEYVISLFKQAYNQGGVLSSTDVAILTKMSSATINKYVKDYMNNHDEIVPTRGFIHDIGPSISHKGIIVGKFLKGKVPNTIAKEVNHSQQAVDRYIKDYERVKICIKKRMKTHETHKATGMSKKLIEKYKELYHTYEGDKHAS
jgi:hypothetical protein